VIAPHILNISQEAHRAHERSMMNERGSVVTQDAVRLRQHSLTGFKSNEIITQEGHSQFLKDQSFVLLFLFETSIRVRTSQSAYLIVY
jgi:hypothetical protein